MKVTDTLNQLYTSIHTMSGSKIILCFNEKDIQTIIRLRKIQPRRTAVDTHMIWLHWKQHGSIPNLVTRVLESHITTI
jgi:hypothetical protein